MLEGLDLPADGLGPSLLSLAVVLGVDLGTLPLLCDVHLVVVRGLEEIVEEVVLGELREAGDVVVVGETGSVLLPVHGSLFLKVAHQ